MFVISNFSYTPHQPAHNEITGEVMEPLNHALPYNSAPANYGK